MFTKISNLLFFYFNEDFTGDLLIFTFITVYIFFFFATLIINFFKIKFCNFQVKKIFMCYYREFSQELNL